MKKAKVIFNAFRQQKVYKKINPAHYLELVVIIFVFKLWCYYLYGVHCDIFYDHHTI